MIIETPAFRHGWSYGLEVGSSNAMTVYVADGEQPFRRFVAAASRYARLDFRGFTGPNSLGYAGSLEELRKGFAWAWATSAEGGKIARHTDWWLVSSHRTSVSRRVTVLTIDLVPGSLIDLSWSPRPDLH